MGLLNGWARDRPLLDGTDVPKDEMDGTDVPKDCPKMWALAARMAPKNAVQHTTGSHNKSRLIALAL